ncbi:MAG TPA: glycosyltransferase [Parafilimonas sp.]|nr:glycosyltransferase [Parafilimonas sp.]
MKILHIVPSYKPAYGYGGTIECIARLCEAQSHAGAIVKVFTTTANVDKELDIEPDTEHDVDGVGVTYFSRVFKDPFYISIPLWKCLYKNYKNYDAVHIHSWWNILVLGAAIICKTRKVKTFFSPHGMMSDFIRQHKNRFIKQSMHVMVGRSLLKYMRFHATSDAEFEECKKLIPGWKGFIIPNIMWLPELKICKQPNEVFTIIYMSRIHPKKGIELLMEAISLLDKKPVLKIAGTGEDSYVKELQQKAEGLGIAANIRWLGWQNRDTKFATLMQADLFALTSYNENFANAVIEALHVGTPVLISEDVGVSSFVKEHGLGWICETTVSSIRLKLEEAMTDTEQRKRINTCGPVMVKNFLSEEKLVREYLVEYG